MEVSQRTNFHGKLTVGYFSNGDEFQMVDVEGYGLRIAVEIDPKPQVVLGYGGVEQGPLDAISDSTRELRIGNESLSASLRLSHGGHDLVNEKLYVGD